MLSYTWTIKIFIIYYIYGILFFFQRNNLELQEELTQYTTDFSDLDTDSLQNRRQLSKVVTFLFKKICIHYNYLMHKILRI